MTVLPAVIGQIPPRGTYWHIRETKGIRVAEEDMEIGCDCVCEVAQFCSSELKRVPDVGTVNAQVQKWTTTAII